MYARLMDVTNDLHEVCALSIAGMGSDEDLLVGCISKRRRAIVRIVLLFVLKLNYSLQT